MKRHLKFLYVLIVDSAYFLVYQALCHLPFFKLYQPIYKKNKNKDLTRFCRDRWEAFSLHLPTKPGSVLDIGCNIGFFSFMAAEKGHFSYGVESDYFNITSCNAIKQTTNSERVLFTKHLIDPEYINFMPGFDTVINLSVFHHWVKAYGADQAQEMMKALAQKCSCMIFETGQSNEKGTKWQPLLSFMGDDPKLWIEDFLKDIGFNQVEMIGTFSTGLTSVDRYLFVAKKS